MHFVDLFLHRSKITESMAWYVVFRGRKPGVYRDWHACNAQVSGFSNCSFRSYRSQDEALAAYSGFCAQEGTSRSQYHGDMSIAAAPLHHGVPATWEEAVGPVVVNMPQAAQTEAHTDLLPVVLILVAIVLSLFGYILS